MATKSHYDGAPRRSQRSRLTQKGYDQYHKDGRTVFEEGEAHKMADRLHEEGYLAQVLRIRDYNIPATWFIVMYKKK